MKATNEKKAEGYSSPYNFEGRIPLSQAIPLGLQHVMGNVYRKPDTADQS